MARHPILVPCFLLALTATIDSRSTNLTNAVAAALLQGRVTAEEPVLPATSGQISGHVYRADTGAPLADAVVMLWTTGRPGYTSESIHDWRSERTAADGSYAFPDLVPRNNYWLIAYRTGFAGPVGRRGSVIEFNPYCLPSQPPPAYPCISVSPGQKVGAIDLRLNPDTAIAPMADGPMVATYSTLGADLNGLHFDGLFSPDGRSLAIDVAVGDRLVQKWSYDMQSQQLTLAASGDWANESQNVCDDEYRNDRFLVTVESDDRNCRESSLWMKRNDGTGAQKIADIDWPLDGLLFDSERSIVIYPKIGELRSQGIVAFDLNTRRSRTLTLPWGERLTLLDRSTDGTVAYSVQGPCLPDDASEQTLGDWISSSEVKGRLTGVLPHICFVKFP